MADSQLLAESLILTTEFNAWKKKEIMLKSKYLLRVS